MFKSVVNSLESEHKPDKCFPTEAEGKKGNMKINKNCGYCEFKKDCYHEANEGRGLRVFKYSKGLMFLETVKAEPKVEEIYEW